MNPVYYLLRVAGFFVALFPLNFFYPLSTVLSWFTGAVFGYRQEVVMGNLRRSFPEKSEKELKQITRKFYQNFTDTIVEIFKQISLNKNLIPKRIKLKNPEILNQYHKEGKSVIAIAGHYCNWEWLAAVLPAITPYQSVAVYRPLTSKVINKIMLRIRSINNLDLTPMASIYRYLKTRKNPVLTILVADQSPQPEFAYWTTFLNQDTAVFTGPEKLAKATGHVVVFLAMQKERRGRYSVTVQELSADPASELAFAITEMHVRALENQIKAAPEFWLWSHKRWKHNRPE